MGALLRVVVAVVIGFTLLPGDARAEDRPLYYTRALTPADLEGRTLRELALMRNTIYARAGHWNDQLRHAIAPPRLVGPALPSGMTLC